MEEAVSYNLREKCIYTVFVFLKHDSHRTTSATKCYCLTTVVKLLNFFWSYG